ncbi:hypothetical protein CWT12_12235 [Actinomyces sp. 432]|uniref:hypothetical protein n=1 Tax=Actinomyces sp. 432 TaxID=2057798 RepID=UPI001373D6FA|nr:hypothetical protein [Actinomyces sp. 432]QHO91920.1 hypothetical protein CWT12_12235 [Actinomyces sp. 432]
MTEPKKPSAAARARRAPQDRLAKGEATGKHSTVEFRGRTLDIDPDRLDDYDAFEALRQGFPGPLMEALIPDEPTRRAVLDDARDDDGRLRTTAVTAIIIELSQAVGAGN